MIDLWRHRADIAQQVEDCKLAYEHTQLVLLKSTLSDVQGICLLQHARRFMEKLLAGGAKQAYIAACEREIEAIAALLKQKGAQNANQS